MHHLKFSFNFTIGIIADAVDNIASLSIPYIILIADLFLIVVMQLVKKKDSDSSTLSAEIIDADTRDNFLFILNDAINYLHHKAVNGKVRNPKTEKIKMFLIL